MSPAHDGFPAAVGVARLTGHARLGNAPGIRPPAM